MQPEPAMTRSALFAETQIHHVALRVADAAASKAWFVTNLDFRVDREFEFGGMDFVWIHPAGEKTPVIELVGGGSLASRTAPENVAEALRQPGFHHICLQVKDVEKLVADLRGRDVKFMIDVMAGAPGSGVDKAAFIEDPWGNVVELLQLTPGS